MTKHLGLDAKLHLEAWCEEPGQDVIIVPNGVLCYQVVGDVVHDGAAWVHPDHRRKGIMTHMVKQLAYLPGVAVLHLRTHKTRPDMAALYRNLGFPEPEPEGDILHWKETAERLRALWEEGAA